MPDHKKPIPSIMLIVFLTCLCMSITVKAAAPPEELQNMDPLVKTYVQIGLGSQVEGAVVDISSKDDNHFWNVMHTFAIYGDKGTIESGARTFSAFELMDAAYALFPDYDGVIPDIPENSSGFGYENNKYYFMLFTPEVSQLVMTRSRINKDQSADAEYQLEFMGTDGGFVPTSSWRVHFDINTYPGSVYDYKILSVKNISYFDQNEAASGQHSISQEQPAASGEYVLPESSQRYIDASELSGLSSDQLAAARNEIYARHGRIFKIQEWQNYFNGKSWYQGTISADAFDEEKIFSEIEKANVKTIVAEENKRK